MKIIKKILFPIFSIFLLYRTVELMRQLMSTNPEAYSFSQLLLIAFLLSLFITGIFAFLGFVYPTSSLLPDKYYRIKDREALKQIYRILGVKYFKYLLLLFFWGRKKNRLKYFNGTRSGLQNFIYQTKQSEFGHAMALLFIDIVSFVLLLKGYFILFGLLVSINLIVNLYPIIVQRHHRARIEKIIKKK